MDALQVAVMSSGHQSMDHCRAKPAKAGGHPVVDFANTLACPGCRAGDALDSTIAARRWLRAHPELPALAPGPPNLKELRRLRKYVRELLSANSRSSAPGSAALAMVNAAAAAGFSNETLEWRGGRWWVRARPRRGSGTSHLIGSIARSTVALLGGPARRKLRACHGPGCVHFLFARTRQQIWCSPTGCGNRVRVARHWRKAKSRDPRTKPQPPG